jgi:carbonic anhydrase
VAAVEENVLVQLEHIQSLPGVAAGLEAGTLALHGWVYKIETGEVFAYERESGQFQPLAGTAPHERPAEDEGRERRIAII